MTMPGFDVHVPNVARIYNRLLDGKDNYIADRAAADDLQKALPDIALACQENRQFLVRVVRYLAAEAGIRQFVDIGAGMPDGFEANVHDIAQGILPGARVAYVDYDPVVIGHARSMLLENEQVAVINADLRTPRDLLRHRALHQMIDFRQPVAILILATLHFITNDEHPYDIVGMLKTAMAPGSYLAISHATQDSVTAEEARDATDVYKNASAQVQPRHYGEVLGFFDGLQMITPGVVGISQWRPDPERQQPVRQLMYGGVARKPAAGERSVTTQDAPEADASR